MIDYSNGGGVSPDVNGGSAYPEDEPFEVLGFV